MANATLVNIDVEQGKKVIQALDSARLKVSVALWLLSSDYYEDYRLVLASKRFDVQGGIKSYAEIHQALKSAGIGVENTPALLILRMADPFVRSLRTSFSKTASVEGMRLGGQLIGDRFVDNAYVYRID
jgi:hypothetical protein